MDFAVFSEAFASVFCFYDVLPPAPAESHEKRPQSHCRSHKTSPDAISIGGYIINKRYALLHPYATFSADWVASDASVSSGTVVAAVVSSGATVAEVVSSGAVVSSGTVVAEVVSSGAVVSDVVSSGAVVSEVVSSGAVVSEVVSSGAVVSEAVPSGSVVPPVAPVGIIVPVGIVVSESSPTMPSPNVTCHSS